MAYTEKQKEYNRRYREKNKKKLDEKSKKWREENREKWLEVHRTTRERPEYKERENTRVKKSRRTNPFKFVLQRARYRARELGVNFDLDREYVEKIWTGRCPILGTTLQLGQKKGSIPLDCLASLDRLDNDIGYIKGNVHFISYRTNNIKTDASFDEFEKIYNWWKKSKEE